MTNPRSHTKKVSPETEKQGAELLKEMEQQAEEATREDEALVVKPLDEMLGQAERAYAAYMEATREVARAYKANELQVAKVYRRAEHLAQAACDETITQALKARAVAMAKAFKTSEEALKQVETAFRQAEEEASRACDDTTTQAIKARDEALANAWKLREDTVEQAWKIYAKITSR